MKARKRWTRVAVCASCGSPFKVKRHYGGRACSWKCRLYPTLQAGLLAARA